MIELKNADKTFRNVHAVDHVTAQIRDGMVFGLIGSNGAGKSTLLRMICGIIRPDSGEVLADGRPVFENPEVKAQICFLSDSPYYFSNADIRQMRDYYCMIYPSFNRKLFDSLTEKFRLESSRKLASFSKGMKKQASILLGLCSGTGETPSDRGPGPDPLLHMQASVCGPRRPQGRSADPEPARCKNRAFRLSSHTDSEGRPLRRSRSCPGAGTALRGSSAADTGRNIHKRHGGGRL